MPMQSTAGRTMARRPATTRVLAAKRRAEGRGPRISRSEDEHALHTLQRQIGNAEVARLVQRFDVERPLPDEDPVGPKPSGSTSAALGDSASAPTGDNPLVGLKEGDGLNFGTNGLRPRVKLLQSRLNETAGAALKADGMWGGKTSEAMDGFELSLKQVPDRVVDQVSGDALMGKGGGGGGGGGGAAPFNPVVESRLEGIAAEYRFIFEAEKLALQRLEVDLTSGKGIEKAEPTLAQKALLAAVFAILEKFVGLNIDELRPDLIKSTFLDDEQITSAVDAPLKPALDEGKTAMGEFLPQQPKGIDDLGAFIETQLQGATQAAATAEGKYLDVTKPSMSRLRAGEVATSDASDPRLLRAEALRAAVRKRRFAAFDPAFNEAMAGWTVYLARKATGDPVSGGGFEEQVGTDMSDITKVDKAGGVLHVDYSVTTADKSPKVEKVSIVGLSEKVRARLKASDRKLDLLGMPVRGEGTGPFAIDRINILVNRNEVGKDFLITNGTDNLGLDFLRQKAARDGFLSVSPESGATLLMNEVLATRTSQVEIERG